MNGRAALIATAGSVLAVHAGPAVSAIGPVRRRTFGTLAGRGDPGRVAITFDDGPDPSSTPAFLDALAAMDLRATFFVLGPMILNAPDLGRRLVDEGHEVAVHGWDHRPVVIRSHRAIRADLSRTVQAITQVCGVRPTRWRPPYGVLSSSALLAAGQLDLTPVLWTTWGRDWERRATPVSIRRQVRRHLGPGGTVLLHDSDCTSAPGSWRATLAAVPGVVADVRTLGLVPGPLRDHDAPVLSRR